MKTVSKGNFNTKVDWKRLQMQTVFGKQFCVWVENNEDLSTTEMMTEHVLRVLLNRWKSEGRGEKISNLVKGKKAECLGESRMVVGEI